MRKYILSALVILVAGISLYLISQPKPSSFPPCTAGVVTFDKITGDLNKLITIIENGEFNIETSIIHAKFMDTKVERFVDKDKLLHLNIGVFGKGSSIESGNKIKCELFENDREDPGKKSQSCKLFAGYLLYTFYVDGEQVYKIQMDVAKNDFSDIKDRMECIKESLLLKAKQ